MKSLSIEQNYFPSPRQWHRIDPLRPSPSEAPFVHLDARVVPVATLKTFSNLQGVWLYRATQDHLEVLAEFASLTCMHLQEPVMDTLPSLGGLTRLRALNLEDPPTLHGLDRLAVLEYLALRHFRRIKSLGVVGALSKLKVLSLSTIPSWDSSRRCLEVESLDPLRRLSRLEWLSLMGVRPLDNRLEGLHGLTNLKALGISHVYSFALEDYAALARALPNTSGHCLQPYYRLPQLELHCKRCNEEVVFLTGPRPRAKRQLCPNCHSRSLQEHQQQWDAAVKGG